MGKDQSGGFHPKSKPSAVNKVEGLGISTTSPEEHEEFLDRADKYIAD